MLTKVPSWHAGWGSLAPFLPLLSGVSTMSGAVAGTMKPWGENQADYTDAGRDTLVLVWQCHHLRVQRGGPLFLLPGNITLSCWISVCRQQASWLAHIHFFTILFMPIPFFLDLNNSLIPHFLPRKYVDLAPLCTLMHKILSTPKDFKWRAGRDVAVFNTVVVMLTLLKTTDTSQSFVLFPPKIHTDLQSFHTGEVYSSRERQSNLYPGHIYSDTMRRETKLGETW